MIFSSAMGNIKGSEVRELLKLTERESVISFAGGMPAAELFPVEQMIKVSEAVLRENGEKALQYAPTDGFLPLREKIAARMNKTVGTKTNAKEIILTNGSQQGLDFTAKMFCDAGDTILVESPTYLGALSAFRPYRPNIVEIPSDEDGMILEELEKALKYNPVIRFVYVIPDFQNPSGLTWSMERRKGFLEIMSRYEIPVIEDNPYGELRFEGEVLPSLKAMDTTERVIFLGTFSKILAPGYRLGWVCANEAIVNKYNMIKQGADLQASSIGMREVDKFLEMYSLDDHIARLVETYRKRRDCMLSAMEEHFPKVVKFTYPKGGLFTWAEFPKDVNARELMAKCLENDVAFVPGGAFFASLGNENYARLNYSAMSEEKIAEGIKRMGVALKDFIK